MDSQRFVRQAARQGKLIDALYIVRYPVATRHTLTACREVEQRPNGFHPRRSNNLITHCVCAEQARMSR